MIDKIKKALCCHEWEYVTAAKGEELIGKVAYCGKCGSYNKSDAFVEPIIIELTDEKLREIELKAFNKYFENLDIYYDALEEGNIKFWILCNGSLHKSEEMIMSSIIREYGGLYESDRIDMRLDGDYFVRRGRNIRKIKICLVEARRKAGIAMGHMRELKIKENESKKHKENERENKMMACYLGFNRNA